MNASIRLDVSPPFHTDIFVGHGLYEERLQTRDALWFYDETLPNEILKKLFNNIPKSQCFALSPGEDAKTTDMMIKMLHFLDTLDLSKESKIIALGGGALSDAVGFIASIYMRGLPFEIIPTTLLSMVDASVGGKTAINTQAKNRVGTFYPASKIWVDINFVDSMPTSLIEDGFSEIIKMAVTLDETFTNQLETDQLSIKEIIQKAIQLKTAIVSKDLMDLKDRKLLNFGHTIGHAIEKHHNYRVSHGKCVAMGMLFELDDPIIHERIKNLLNKFHCLIPLSFDKTHLIQLIKKDKKRSQKSITWIQLDKIGHAYLKELSLSELEDRIQRL